MNSCENDRLCLMLKDLGFEDPAGASERIHEELTRRGQALYVHTTRRRVPLQVKHIKLGPMIFRLSKN